MTKIVDKCPFCKRVKNLLKSNNPLVAPICEDCINEQIDPNNLKLANFFCRTYNIPFDPNKWLDIAKEEKEKTFATYIQVISDENSNTLYHGDATDLLWDKANEQWEQVQTHEQLIQAIKPVKEGWLQMMQIKWGQRFTFQQYLELENLYTSTVRAAGITNPLTMAIIKKIAIANVDMNTALDDLDVKAATNYNKIISDLIKSAGIEQMVDVGSTEVISTVSELCQYLEDNNFQFRFYDQVSRDIVDATIEDQKEWTRNFVLGATGIQQTYELIEDAYIHAIEETKTKDAVDKISLDEIVGEKLQGINREFDQELEDDDYDLGEFDDK